MSDKPSKGKMQVKGVIQLVIGVLIFVWLAQIMKNTPGASLNFVGYGQIIIGLLLVISGVINLFQSLQADNKTDKQ